MHLWLYVKAIWLETLAQSLLALFQALFSIFGDLLVYYFFHVSFCPDTI
jgi:hypothetical protein